MRWVNEAKARYYQAWLTEDLFGDWTLVTAWGGLGSRRGQARLTAVPSYEDGLARIEEIAKRRRQRGYRSVETA
jgi:predicted DNA-binding WGR domain protein